MSDQTGAPRPTAGPPDDAYNHLVRAVPWTRRVAQLGRQLSGASRRQAPRRPSRRADLAAQLQLSVTTGRRVAVVSVRGGAGKSTLAALVGSAFATHRHDRIVLVDADPDPGSIPLRLGVTPGPSLRALFARGGEPGSFDDLSPHLRQSSAGLWTLSGHQREAGASSPVDVISFTRAQPVLSRYFAMSLVDCGPGLYGELAASILSRAHALLLVTHATADGVRSARQTLDQLTRTFHRPLLDRCVLALVEHTDEPLIDVRAAVHMLTVSGVHVVHVPYDRHLAAGGTIDLWRIHQDVQDAVFDTAAATLLRATQS